jgi:hypothetical protein
VGWATQCIHLGELLVVRLVGEFDTALFGKKPFSTLSTVRDCAFGSLTQVELLSSLPRVPSFSHYPLPCTCEDVYIPGDATPDAITHVIWTEEALSLPSDILRDWKTYGPLVAKWYPAGLEISLTIDLSDLDTHLVETIAPQLKSYSYSCIEEESYCDLEDEAGSNYSPSAIARLLLDLKPKRLVLQSIAGPFLQETGTDITNVPHDRDCLSFERVGESYTCLDIES